MGKFVRGLLLPLLLFVLSVAGASAQRGTKVSRLDSTVTVFSNGDVRVQYFAPVFDFGRPLKISEDEKKALDATMEAERIRFEKELQKKTVPRIARKSALRMTAGSASYAVGEIPMQEGVTATGGKTYQIPIATASGYKLTPSVSVCYNSQAAGGWAGYGWDISGVSSITLIGKNKYYHGKNKGANVWRSDDAAFALDGVPLLENKQSETKAAYPLITATGNIIVAPSYNMYGFVSSFTAKYPDGSTAVFNGEETVSNSYNLVTYLITELTDVDGNKVTFHYPRYSFQGPEDRLDAIRYGYDASGQYRGEITFTYTRSTDLAGATNVSRHYAGRWIERGDRLSAIATKNDGEIICEYAFSYEEADGVSLLSRVDCSAAGEMLPPLLFEYGATGAGSSSMTPYLYQDGNTNLSKQYTNSDIDFVYKRGKFMPGSHNDGLIVYPLYENYAVIDSYKPFLAKRRYLFGSPYPENQAILFAPSLTDFSSQVYDTIMTGDGFQTIEAVDVDGDGVDELVKVNFNGTIVNCTKLRITVYECNSSGAPVQSSQFDVEIPGVITSGNYVSPYRREYFWGDFLGNGKTQLLTIAYDKNYNGVEESDQISYATVIDISARVRGSGDVKLFDYSLEHAKYLLVCDLDNDSQTELCFTTNSGLDVYRLESTSFVKERTVSGLTPSFWSYNDRPYFVTDLEGDGYIDILYPSGLNASSTSGLYDRWDIRRFTGQEFVGSYEKICPYRSYEACMFVDINRDGCADLVKNSGTALETYINLGDQGWLGQQSPSTVTNKKGMVPANVVNFLGETCFIKVEGLNAKLYKYSAPSPQLRQLTKSTDSYGRMSVNAYAYLPEKIRSVMGAGWWDDSFSVNNANGFAFKTLPMYVLEREDSYLSSTTNLKYKSLSYIYYNAVVHNQGLGFCGFSMVRSADLLRNIYVDEIHNPEKLGVVTSVRQRMGSVSATPFFTVTNTYDVNRSQYVKIHPRLTESVESNTLTGITTTTSYAYGDFDLPTKVITSRRIGLGEIKRYVRFRTYQNNVSATNYILGLVKEEIVVKEGDGDSSLSWGERTINTYDSNYRLSSSKCYVGQIGLSSLDLSSNYGLSNVSALSNVVNETRWQYDSFGNIASKKSAPYSATEFVGSSYTYDSNGHYLLTETDALGHTTTYSGYNKFGKPTMVSDYRNRATTYVYDPWGAVIGKTHPDGTVEQSSSAWGGAGLYTMTHTVTGAPETITHYDALDREVRTGEKRFNGQWQYIDKTYDGKGRLQKTSLPYRGSSPVYWNTYAYDNYDRPVSLTEASGKISTWSYSGVSTTTVKDGVSSTSTTDANGNVISVVDAGGTITYTLRDDGQPESITAPGGVQTTFGYDDYGRRTQISDPSAGVQTDSYVWNSDGSSVQTHVNPNGTVKTYTDKYGRPTKVERPGEYTTTYTYNSYNLLSKEQSTNGTSTEFSYDSYDRISASKETVPDGKWLQKTYTYAAGSVLSAIVYASQSGSITTETYTYSNGHNTGITLPDGTVIWSLAAENDLGQPTSITSGGISREYGYTAYGMPTYRRMAGGALQDMQYQFNPQTGNLGSRRDNTRGLTETFTYDGLNRLVSIDNRQITYADNGNVLSVGGVGSMSYNDGAHPYQITSLTAISSGLVANRSQSVSYTCYNRPSVLSEGGRSAAFTYNGDGDRVKMYVANGSSQVLTRYYIGGRYEFDQTPSGTKERLYLGGDAYSAPMVYQRENGGSWTVYNIGRDYLGNITQIATASGTLVAEYSYDPWGRLRNPSTLAIYAPGSEPELFLGRGFTGHEHLAWFGLVNMNARLYDPLLGRFLSPDPYVQAPDFTQNFNRYSYALNNPLRFTDTSGELFGIDDALIAISIGAIIGAINGAAIAARSGAQGFSEWAGYIFGGATIGVLSGALGSLVGGAVASAANLGGFLGGAVLGASSGASGGALSGFYTTLLAGGNVADAGRGALSSAGFGALAGGVLGGFSGGVQARRNGGNFWTGIGESYDYAFDASAFNGNDAPVEYSQRSVQDFSDKHFKKIPKNTSLLADGSLPEGYSSDLNGIVHRGETIVYGSCQRTEINQFTIYIFKSACSSKQQLYLTLGHEYYHVFLRGLGITDEFVQHTILTDWQIRQALEWNYNIQSQMRTFYKYHPGITEDYNYLGLNNLFPILNRWHIL